MITKEELKEKIKNGTEKTFGLGNVKFDKSKYSRVSGIDQNIVEEYTHDIVNMPPIIINQNNIIVNGVHRYMASKRIKQNSIKVIRINLDDDDIKMAGLLLDLDYGLRHPEKDKKSICVNMFDGSAERDKYLIEQLNIIKSTYYKWTENRRKEKQEEVHRNMIMDYLSDPNKTQEQVAKDYEYSVMKVSRLQEDISTILNEMLKSLENDSKMDKINKIIKDIIMLKMSEKGTKIDEINKLLESLSLSFIKDALLFKPYLYNIWSLGKSDTNSTFFGKFPNIYMENLLYYHTKPFGIVYDPFAGSGTTIDACKKMLRRYICSDLNPLPDRKAEIYEWDITKGFPNFLSRFDFLFLDPPYWKQARKRYSNTHPNDLSYMSLEDFNNTMESIFNLSNKLKIETIACVVQPTEYSNDFDYVDHIFDFDKMISDKYKIEKRYILPYSTEQYKPQMVIKAKENNIALTLHRDLIVWKRKNKDE